MNEEESELDQFISVSLWIKYLSLWKVTLA